MSLFNIFSSNVANLSAGSLVEKSQYISRDLSWLKFNQRVFDQAQKPERTILERLKFMAIANSNLDEFFMIRVGSLYNYIDYNKERVDYSGLKAGAFRKKLLREVSLFFKDFYNYYNDQLVPEFGRNGFRIVGLDELKEDEKEAIDSYYHKTIHPMLTPMLTDSYHTFPILANKVLIFGVVTRSDEESKDNRRLSFVPIPQNLSRFYEIERADETIFVPIEEIIRWRLYNLFRNVEIETVNLFRIIRNGDFTIEEVDDADNDFIDEIKKKINTRKTGRVVRIDIEKDYSTWMIDILKDRWDIDDENIMELNNLIDFSSLWQIIKHPELKNMVPDAPAHVSPLTNQEEKQSDIFETLKDHDVLLHHPYNSMDTFIDLLEKSADDPKVLAIKITIYRLAKDSRVSNALYRAAENGKHVSVLFEVKARFDEEQNIQQAKRLQKAGCFVIYGLGSVKTHTKLCLIVRKEDNDRIVRYVHLSSGNYNELTSKLYTDVGLLTTNDIYANDVAEFFNVITGHSIPKRYNYLIAAPQDMRKQLITLVDNEIANAKKGLPSGIVIKINSLQDLELINALYEASMNGVKIKLIIRGICSLRPGRAGLSENITVRSIVGDFLEHSRLFYFHNNGAPQIYGGSADAMVRSFDRRVESLYLIIDEQCRKEATNILVYNLKDNVNAYEMREDGDYKKVNDGKEPFNIHQEFYRVTKEIVETAELF